MGFCGDAMKAEISDLIRLLELQDLEIAVEKLKQQMTELASGKALENLRDQILAISAQLTTARSKVEELERDQRRALEDLRLVEERIKRDKEKLSKTAVSRDALGIQHELETLNKRKSELEDSEIFILEQLEGNGIELTELLTKKAELEQEFQSQKNQMQVDLENMKSRLKSDSEGVAALRNKLPDELIGLFDKKKSRGVAVGRMVRNTCGACNMGLTASAAHEILAQPSDELVTCPECAAILVRS
jgi:predicted  nucleic acid-binding Zn-ribbon protein